jgi:uncharacterized repeat protein (TIGR02543 family)/LPXTG-motif cell wall-anchored protein
MDFMPCQGNNEYAYSIGVDNADNVFMAGQYESTVDFDPGSGTENLTSAGGSDGFILRMNSAGSTATPLNIAYDSQGGSAVSDGDATTTTGGTISSLPTDPTRDGYTLNGWFTAASGGTEITTIAAHNQTADFTLYAQWTANPTTTTTTTTTVAPTTTAEAPTTTVAPTTTAEAPTTSVAPTTEAPTTTIAPTTTVVLPATGSSNGTITPVLLMLGLGGLFVLFTRRRLHVRD